MAANVRCVAHPVLELVFYRIGFPFQGAEKAGRAAPFPQKNINRKARSVYAIQALLPVAWRITNSVPSIRTIPMGRAIIPVIPKCTRRPAIR